MTNTPPRILVVDDEPDIESLIRQKFRREIKAGTYDIRFARDGVEALEKLASDAPIDVVFSDINMPRMDGLSFLSELVQSAEPPAVVMVSAYGDMPNIRAAMNGGAFDFLTKPIEFDDLSATLQKCLSHRDQLHQLQEETTRARAAEATLARYFAPAVIHQLTASGTAYSPASERRTSTFLFTDLENFLPLVERAEPQPVIDLLNGYLDGITRCVFDHGGTMLKIIGDGVHAVFGAPFDLDDHARAATQCALAIDAFCEDFRARQEASGVPLGKTRIGVHTGEAILGNFGGDMYFDYAAYGSAVNIASRLEGANKVLGTRICVSETTVAAYPDFTGRQIGALRLRGRDAPLRSFEPLPPEAASPEALTHYAEALEGLQAGDPEARARLVALIAANPDDALAAFHLARHLAGTWTPEIDVSALS
ncbi:adenylate/guanylate cyclase domain-containing protein [Pacificoceanicola onchidii]|uniref:adenylate/guanylate cyclase domain-containing protein n=1 Tax=Pacificoceanicola onchidii TaxID=2562685 RepID=UPI0010A2EACD|nr:adenylate/guanylate cyclase domain-containing response regulator [Pacificoceanicola onchidii]